MFKTILPRRLVDRASRSKNRQTTSSRKENGHVFQGRYKAILLDEGAIGPVCHYIHLNPVRAGLVESSDLERYGASSFHRFWHPRRRRSHESFALALNSAGGLADTPKGRRLYGDYLGWLAEEDKEQKRLGFERMCRGWVKGTRDFRKAVLADLKSDAGRRVTEAEAAEMREPRWERAVSNLLERLDRSEEELAQSPKGAPWKVAMARLLRERYLTPNSWIAERLHMGKVSTVQSAVSRHRSGSGVDPKSWEEVQKHETLG
ncbi:MAG: transposase [Verrucomicrobia bacterium]|jgi:hypothetical protein|nr:transposase [Verrucomicrobiota bacterium]